jgi:hypothetical protein
MTEESSGWAMFLVPLTIVMCLIVALVAALFR